MQTIKIGHPARPFTIYRKTAFDGSIGMEIDFIRRDGSRGSGVIREADVAEDGTFVTFTVELPDGTIPPDPEALRGVSVDEG